MADALQAYLDSVRETPFAWGEHDCALFPAKFKGDKYVRAIRAYGCDTALKYRRMLSAKGWGLKEFTEELLGPPCAAPMMRDDVVLLRNHLGQESLGLAVPPLVLHAGPNGTEAVPASFTVCWWRVED